MGKCIKCGRPCVTDGQEAWCPPCAARKISELKSKIAEFIHDENNPPAGQFITNAEIDEAVRWANTDLRFGLSGSWVALNRLNIFRREHCASDPSLRGWVRRPKSEEVAGGDG